MKQSVNAEKQDMKKWNYLIAAGLLVLTSCHQVLFVEPQPNFKRDKKSFSRSLQGTYISEDGSDSLIIGKDFFSLDPKNRIWISDSLKVRKFHGYWFVNAKPSKEKYWTTAFVKDLNGKSIFVYMLDHKESLSRLKKITPVSETKKANGQTDDYIINPDKKALKRILDEGVLRKPSIYLKLAD